MRGFLCLVTLPLCLWYVVFLLLRGSNVAKHRPTGSGDIPGGEVHQPPCMAAGDDRPGAEPPSWVPPIGARVSRGYLAANDDEWRRTYPTLHDWLTLTGVSGKDREVGTFTFFAQDGMFKMALNDKESGLVCFLSSKTVSGVLGVAEAGLKAGTLEWRETKYRRK